MGTGKGPTTVLYLWITNKIQWQASPLYQKGKDFSDNFFLFKKQASMFY
jgi:hypothetical protein